MNVLPKELRLALCMRGGVSLAVWMGGACREIAALRGAPAAAPPGAEPLDPNHAQRLIYSFLLRYAGYESVNVDVLTGTSAGGLNGVLFASHLVYGLPFDNTIRDLWLRLGDLEGLTRKPGESSPPSLLLGDKGFYDKVFALLDSHIDITADTLPGPVRLILTATRLHPRNEYLRTSIGAPMLVNWSRAHMVFRHHHDDGPSAHPIFSDFVPDNNNPLELLAYAARATSSFPVAFEPAAVNVAPGPSTRPSFFGLSSETCSPDSQDGTVQLMDGGVLDNVPLAWAIRAVAGAPAGAAVDRWLMYLEPVPPTLPDPKRLGDGSLARLAGVIRSLLSAKANSESLLEDAGELRDAWSSAQRLHGVANGIPGNPGIAGLPGADDLDPETYAQAVARVEADRLARLIEDPMTVVGPDPLPIPDTNTFTNDQSRWPLLAALRGPVITALALDEGADFGVSAFRSPFAAARAVALALDWLTAVEASCAPEDVRPLRLALHDVRFACEVLIAARDRLLLRGGSPSIVSPEAWVRKANQRLHYLLTQAMTDCTDMSDTLAAVCDQAVNDPLPTVPLDFPESFTEIIWDRVTEICQDIRTLNVAATGFEALAEACDDADTSHVLAVAEVMLGPLRPNPLTEPTQIQLHTISANERSPLAPHFFGGTAPARDELVDRKLSGNNLMNFASFLSSRWRLNDWTWGRLDAASSLADVVGRDERVRHGVIGPKQLEALRSLHTTLTADEELAALIGSWDSQNLSPASPARLVPDVLKKWLHWNIARQEIPLLKALNDQPRTKRDLPPSPGMLSAPRRPLTMADATILGDVGSESVRDLLARLPLRRSVMRLGLVAWRAVQPAGGGAAWLVQGLFALLKPLVMPPLLIGFLSPAASIIAGVLSWIALTVATDRWFSTPGHHLVAAGIAVAAGCGGWRWWAKRGHRNAATRAFFLGLGTVAALLLAGILWLRHLPWDITWSPPVLAGLLSGAAVFVSLWGVNRFGWVFTAVAAPALISGAVVALVAHPLGGWAAMGTLYAAIATETVLLTLLYPMPRQP